MQPNLADFLVALITAIVVCIVGITLPTITLALGFMIFWNLAVMFVVALAEKHINNWCR